MKNTGPLIKTSKKNASSSCPEMVGPYRLTKTLGQGSYGRVKRKLSVFLPQESYNMISRLAPLSLRHILNLKI